MDAETLSTVFAERILPVTIFFGILAIFGAIGNLCVLYVYTFRYPACNFRTFVIGLAATDFVSCLFVFPCEIVGHRIWFSYPKSAAWFCKLKTLVFAMAVMTTSLMLLLIAVDRFRKVCHPFESQIKPNTALRLCFVTLGVSFLMNLPIPILFGIQTENITYAGEVFEITSCEKDNAFKNTIWMMLWAIIMYYTPVILFMTTTSVLYCLILKKMYSRNFLRTTCVDYVRRKMNENNVKDTKHDILENGVCQPLTKHADIVECDKTKTRSDEKFNEMAIPEIKHLEIEQKINVLQPMAVNTKHSGKCRIDGNNIDKKTRSPQTIKSAQNIPIIAENSSKLQMDFKTKSNQYMNDLDNGHKTTDMADTQDSDHKDSTQKRNSLQPLICNSKKCITPQPDTSITDIESTRHSTIEHTSNACPATVITRDNSEDFKLDRLQYIGELNDRDTISDLIKGDNNAQVEKAHTTYQTITQIRDDSKMCQGDKTYIDSSNENDIDQGVRSETNRRTRKDNNVMHRNKSMKITISKPRVTRKTTIMFIVTIIFNITTLVYFCVLFLVVRREHIFEIVSTDSAGILFLCWRIYFINHVINPVVYGLLDQRFRSAFNPCHAQ